MAKKVKKITLARYLYREFMFGAELIVKNKDGSCYLVDHGNSGLVKVNDHWEDVEYGEDENVFSPAKYDFDFISWEDGNPLDIYDYLVENGWIDKESNWLVD